MEKDTHNTHTHTNTNDLDLVEQKNTSNRDETMYMEEC